MLEPVRERLLAAPERFDFFQATYLLERFSGKGDLGEAPCAQAEPVQFQASAQLGFSNAAIESVTPKAASFAMTVVGFGVLGAEGVMPLHYSEWVAAQARQGPSALMAFIDLFHQRCLTLLYRSWKKYRHPSRIVKSRGEAGGVVTSGIAQDMLSSLVGLPLECAVGNEDTERQVLLQYAGLMARGQLGGQSLSRMLSDYFGLALIIHEFEGGWEPIAPAYRTRLPSQHDICQNKSKGQACLGMNTVLGERAWQVTSKIRVEVMCASAEIFADFSPGGRACQHLTLLLRHALGVGVTVDLELTVLPECLPDPVLPKASAGISLAQPLSLGRNSVLKTPDCYDGSEGAADLVRSTAQAAARPCVQRPLRVCRHLSLAAGTQ